MRQHLEYGGTEVDELIEAKQIRIGVEVIVFSDDLIDGFIAGRVVAITSKEGTDCLVLRSKHASATMVEQVRIGTIEKLIQLF